MFKSKIVSNLQTFKGELSNDRNAYYIEPDYLPMNLKCDNCKQSWGQHTGGICNV